MSNLPTTMTAIEISKYGPPECLKPTERPVPNPGPGEVLIRVVSAGVNRPDVMQRLGSYPPPPGASDIPGLEVAGTIVALGEGAEGWSISDKCCALVAGGGYAEYCTAPAATCMPIPKGFSLEAAASVVETAFTVWANVFMRGNLKDGETFLVHGGTSGIGTMAIQMARAFGARVFASAGSAKKCAVCEELGAERAINYREEDFVTVLKEAGRADVILDMVGGDYIQRNLDCLKIEGRSLPDCLPGHTDSREVQLLKNVDPAPDPHRFDTPSAHRRRKSYNRHRIAPTCLATAGNRRHQAGPP